jgi:nucleotide-binding universal stress UspA family protein
MISVLQPRVAPAMPGVPTASCHVVVGLDGTSPSECALDLAVALARGLPADVVLVRSYEWRAGPSTPTADHPSSATSRSHQPLYEASLALSRMEHRLATRGVRVAGYLLQRPLFDAMAEVSEHCPASLLVMSPAPSLLHQVAWPMRLGDLLEATRAPVLLLSSRTRSPFTARRTGHIEVVARPNAHVGEAPEIVPTLAALARVAGSDVVLPSGWGETEVALTRYGIRSTERTEAELAPVGPARLYLMAVEHEPRERMHTLEVGVRLLLTSTSALLLVPRRRAVG